MTPASQPLLVLPEGYADWLAQLKGQIAQAQQRAALAVNVELVQLYIRIGRDIVQRQQTQGWGAKVIDRLARDLKDAFSDIRGWSSSNLKHMRFFALHCPDSQFGQQPADQLPWSRVAALQHGWSRCRPETNRRQQADPHDDLYEKSVFLYTSRLPCIGIAIFYTYRLLFSKALFHAALASP